MRKHLRNNFFVYCAIVLFFGISIAMIQVSPTWLLDVIGSDNAYIIMFCLALVGGITTFSGIPYHVILMGFASAGVNPVLLGLVVASGVMLGDSTSYLLGRGGRNIIPQKFQTVFAKISHYLEQHPRLVFPTLFFYGSCSPLSNDFIVISLGLARFSYWRMIIPLYLGNIIFNITIAYIGIYAWQL